MDMFGCLFGNWNRPIGTRHAWAYAVWVCLVGEKMQMEREKGKRRKTRGKERRRALGKQRENADYEGMRK